ncbi:hypothetical protein ECG_02232 [Echinococcus granulosus]|uniref:DUF5732 domain-containing protein n=1 Tax=Echinococcus granulosus TaxID=6210 RepID=U6JC32_ECHGR|nr:hypothetical protein EGR_10803 [Echinococcus granulosus]EUB54340.1 hypothetical protein EGR_10803 [Echinococcus granulosus]KAH9284452.1 hypothetical protein ECG_02656 [Echinococcus granulosus]KAH9284500.1 hypothetical protein ECG_02232 [Echinococcus granulosus]CDS21655.1 hypothetical protein EgrG_000114700 [Echinococcus granulosus]
MYCLGLSLVKGSEQQQSKLQGIAFIPKEAVEDEIFEIEKGNVSPVDLAFTPERRHQALTIAMPLAALHPHLQHKCLPAMPGVKRESADSGLKCSPSPSSLQAVVASSLYTPSIPL